MALEFEIALHAVANTPAILLPPTSRDTVKSIAVSKDNLEQRELITNAVRLLSDVRSKWIIRNGCQDPVLMATYNRDTY